jgi:hypothetical protein
VEGAEMKWQKFCIISGMDHSCHYLCSELVTVIYEEQPCKLCQATANLEEISSNSAMVLLDERPRLGSPISLTVKGHELSGVITSRLYDTTLGWLVGIALDSDSTWRREWFSPKHLLPMCGCSFQGATRPKARALENTKITEENTPVSFLVRQG